MPPLTFSSNFSSPPDSGRIRCVCEYDEDDGFTIQCEQCLVWQHAKCVGISKNSVPEQYFCDECNPGWHEDLHNLALRAINLDVINSHSANVNIIEDSGNNLVSFNSVTRPFKRKIILPTGVPALNEIVENIISNDAQPFIESFLNGLNIPRLKRQQYAQDPNLLNFEFQSTVVMDSSEHLALLQKNLEVREIRARGYQKKGSSTKYGLFATESCDPGHFVCEFIGHVQLKKLLTVKGSKEFPVTVTQSFVLFPLAAIDLAVDARKFGTGARYARRSCRPNVQIKPIIVENSGTGEFSLSWGLFAKNTIKANNEIFLPLDYQCGNGLFRYECACNAPEFCLGPIDNFTISVSTPALKEMTIQKPSGSPKPAASILASVESAELEALGIRRSSSAVLQDSQVAPTTMTRPILDTRKLSREERKLQKYIEYFEKMDSADAAKKVTSSSSNSSIGSRKGSSSGSSPQASSSRISSPEKVVNGGGLKKAWKKLFSSSDEPDRATAVLATESVEGEIEERIVTAKKRGRKPVVKPQIINAEETINTGDADNLSESNFNPSSPLKPKPKSPPKRKKSPKVDLAIVDEDFIEEIDVGSEFGSGKGESESLAVKKKTKLEHGISKKLKTKETIRHDNEKGEEQDFIKKKKPQSTKTVTDQQNTTTATTSPIIDIERSSSVVSSSSIIPPVTTAPDTPSKKKLSLSDYLKKKKASPVGPISLNFDENEEGEIPNTEQNEYEPDVVEKSDQPERDRELEGFGFLSESVITSNNESGQIREYLRQSISSMTNSQSFEDIDSDRRYLDNRDSDHRTEIRDSRDRRISQPHLQHQPPPSQSQPTSSRYLDERDREHDRLQREREFERREAERERERRERMEREHRDRRDREPGQNYQHSQTREPLKDQSSYPYPHSHPHPHPRPHPHSQYYPHPQHSRFNRVSSPPHYRPHRPSNSNTTHYNRPPPQYNEQNSTGNVFRPPNSRQNNNNYNKY